MAPLQSGAPVPPAADKAYDPEIKDMADYIHNYNVNSDLAVSYPLPKNQLNQR
jgi:2-methylcitrate dehydratase